MGRAVTPDLADRIVDALRKGVLTPGDIAVQCSLSVATISRIAKANGIRIAPEPAADVIERLDALSRTRALTESESTQLWRAIRREREGKAQAA